MNPNEGTLAGQPFDYGKPQWSDESGLAKWIRENPEEAEALDCAIAEQLGRDMRTASDFLHTHPTPWRIENLEAHGELHEAIVDANGNAVLATQDAESFQSRFAPHGAANALVEFVNAAADSYIR